MKTKTSACLGTLAFVVGALLTSCGGTAPMELLDVAGTPALGYPVNETTDLLNFTSGTSSSGTYLLAHNNGAASGINVLAMANGVVTQADANSITIYHSPSISSRFTNLQSVIVQVGQKVVERQLVALYAPAAGLGALGVSVLQDGAVVCPERFFSTVVKTTLITRFGTAAAFFCQ